MKYRNVLQVLPLAYRKPLGRGLGPRGRGFFGPSGPGWPKEHWGPCAPGRTTPGPGAPGLGAWARVPLGLSRSGSPPGAPGALELQGQGVPRAPRGIPVGPRGTHRGLWGTQGLPQDFQGLPVGPQGPGALSPLPFPSPLPFFLSFFAHLVPGGLQDRGERGGVQGPGGVLSPVRVSDNGHAAKFPSCDIEMSYR